MVKPLVAASAHGTTLLRSRAPAAIARSLDASLAGRPVVVQPFMEEVCSRGEWSLVFIDGRFTHAALKRPGSGEFRVQAHLGGTASAGEPPADVRAAACRALGALPVPPLYARVDGIETDEGLLVMEMEVNEPGLFFDLAPAAAERFADAVLERLSRGRFA